MTKNLCPVLILISLIIFLASLALFVYLNYFGFISIVSESQTSLFLLIAAGVLGLIALALSIACIILSWVQGDSSSEIKAVLQIADELLGKLPQADVAKFSKSKDFELYERVLKKHKVK